MLILLVIIATALMSGASVWFLTMDDMGLGNPLLSFLVAFLVVLVWAWIFQKIEQAYISGKLESVKKWLFLWGSSMGVGETMLLRLWIAVESRDDELIETSLKNLRSVNMLSFGKAWAKGHQERISGRVEQAINYFVAGSKMSKGIDKAELLCEAAFLNLQVGTIMSFTGKGNLEPIISKALEYSDEADQLIRRSDLGVGGKKRAAYVASYRQGVRAMIYLVQGREREALDRLERTMSEVRHQSSMRSRRLRYSFRIERVLALHALERTREAMAEVDKLSKEVGLPELRLRLNEVISTVKKSENYTENKSRMKQEKEEKRKPVGITSPTAHEDEGIKGEEVDGVLFLSGEEDPPETKEAASSKEGEDEDMFLELEADTQKSVEENYKEVVQSLEGIEEEPDEEAILVAAEEEGEEAKEEEEEKEEELSEEEEPVDFENLEEDVKFEEEDEGRDAAPNKSGKKASEEQISIEKFLDLE